MRIVYLLTYFELVGGQELYLARQQAKQGHEVFVVAAALHYPLSNMKERYELEGFAANEYSLVPGETHFDGLTIIRLPVLLHYQDFVLVRGVHETLRRLHPDIVFGHEPKTIVPALGALYKKELGYVYILDVHDFFHRVQNHAWWQRGLRYMEYFWWRRWIVNAALRRADRVVAVAPECRTFLEKHHRFRKDRLIDLPLGVDSDYFTFKQEARVEYRKRLGYTDSDIVLIFSGYMFRRKALEGFLDLLHSVRDIPLKVLLVGEGPEAYMKELKSLAEKKGIRGQVDFFGFASREEMASLYAAADIGVWPGNNTLAILEAMACRLPIIIAKMQLAHLATHDNGLCVPYADIPALRSAVEYLARSKQVRQRMGENSEKAVAQHYSYAALAQQVTKWMEELLREKSHTDSTHETKHQFVPGNR